VGGYQLLTYSAAIFRIAVRINVLKVEKAGYFKTLATINEAT
jgi:hypothetical protein